MATISTLDQIIAGVQPPTYFAKPQTSVPNAHLLSYWAVSGIPGPGTFNTTLAGGTYSSSGGLVTGMLPRSDPPTGVNAYINRLSCGLTPFNNQGAIYICDRLWDNGGINVGITTSQTVNSPTWPARDANGATAGASIMMGLEVQVATTGTVAPTLSISYTNSFGTSGRTASTVDSGLIVASPVATFYRIAWHSGDAGVQSIQSLTFGGTVWTGGTVNLVAYRIITMLPCQLSIGSSSQDCVTGGLPRVYNGTVPFILIVAGGSSTGLTGMYQEVQI